MAFEMGFNHYPDVDAIYLKLRDTEYGVGQELDDSRHINLDKDGNVLGVEFLYVSDGVDLDGIPAEVMPQVNALLEQAGVKVNAPA